MKRSIIWLLALGLVLPGLLAQDRSVQTIDPVRIYDGTVEHQKTVLAAKVFEFRYPAKDLANAIGRYFQDRGGKLSKVKGLTVVSGIRLHDSDDDGLRRLLPDQRQGFGEERALDPVGDPGGAGRGHPGAGTGRGRGSRRRRRVPGRVRKPRGGRLLPGPGGLRRGLRLQPADCVAREGAAEGREPLREAWSARAGAWRESGSRSSGRSPTTSSNRGNRRARSTGSRCFSTRSGPSAGADLSGRLGTGPRPSGAFFPGLLSEASRGPGPRSRRR